MQPSSGANALTNTLEPSSVTVVILGASNIALGLPTLLKLLQAGFTGATQALVACGHGRSYGQWSRMLWRGLPGISHCGLWNALDQSDPETPVVALLTDFGNDLIYGVTASQLLRWTESCLERLSARMAKVTICTPPIVTLPRRTQRQLTLFKRCFFPRTTTFVTNVLDELHRFDEGLQHLAVQYRLTAYEPHAEWYGIDPIHWRLRKHGAIFTSLFATWEAWQPPQAPIGSASFPEWLRVLSLKPERHLLFGRCQPTQQPCWTAGNHSLSLF